jgi:hypothetical protein
MLNKKNLFLNATFGDGCVTPAKEKVCLLFGSSKRSIIEYKASILEGNVREGRQDKNSWSPGKPVYSTSRTIVNPFPGMSKLDLIRQLEYEDFLLWILDDGSYHKRSGFLNLNSHALTLAENIELSFHLWHSLGIESRVYTEVKKDGRIFFYLYIPGAQYDSIKLDLKEFLVENAIEGFDYKAGF